MIRFLVIGASGLIGRRFLRTLGPHQAVGTYHARSFTGGVRFDMAADRIEALLDSLDGTFTHGLVLGAIANIDSCATDPLGTGRVNVDGVIRVIEGLSAQGIVPIFASSDGVYDGSHGNWREDDPARPILTYGRQKLAVERYLAGRPGIWVALRIAKVLDPELDPQGVLGLWIDQLLDGHHIRCAVDQRWTPVGVDDVVVAVRRLAEVGAYGLYNLGGGEAVSRIELLEMLVKAIAKEQPVNSTIERCSIRDFALAEARPLDTTMSIAKLKAAIRFEPEALDALCIRSVLSRLKD